MGLAKQRPRHGPPGVRHPRGLKGRVLVVRTGSPCVRQFPVRLLRWPPTTWRCPARGTGEEPRPASSLRRAWTLADPNAAGRLVGSAEVLDRAVLTELLAIRTARRRYDENVNQKIAALHSGAGAPVWLRQAVAVCDRAVGRVDDNCHRNCTIARKAETPRPASAQVRGGTDELPRLDLNQEPCD